MLINYVEIIGIAAGTCTTAAFVPQIIKAWQTRSANDVSLTMYLVLMVGLCLWLIYGLLIGSFSVLLANAITLIFVAIIILLKRKF